MKLQKFLIFVISILSISIVVFNNVTDIAEKLFVPKFDKYLFTSFAILTLVIVSYAFINKDMLKWV